MGFDPYTNKDWASLEKSCPKSSVLRGGVYCNILTGKWSLNVIHKPKVWYLNFLSSFFHMKIFKTRENICTRSQCSFPGFQLHHTYFKIVEKVIFSKIRNFRQRLLTTCWTYGIFDIGAVEGPIWSPFSPNFMVPHLILAQGPKKNQFFVSLV